jgi:hypothetical protein
MRVLLIPLACAVCGCAAVGPGTTAAKPAAPPPAPAVTNLAPYFASLGELVTADPARQSAMLGELQVQQAPADSSRATLRYALALGAAGREASDPVEGRRLLDGLIAAPGDLDAAEVELARAMRREFDARVTLGAQLAQQREELDQRLAASNEAHARAAQAAAAENARLKRELARAETKLQAITEMERELLEQAETVPPKQP